MRLALGGISMGGYGLYLIVHGAAQLVDTLSRLTLAG